MLKRTLATLRRWISQAAEPRLLFPAIAIIGLAAIWATTVHLRRIEFSEAERRAAAASAGLADTYSAYVANAVDSIDRTLRAVRYAYERDRNPAVLKVLEQQSVLPSNLWFAFSIADRSGRIVASTAAAAPDSIADRSYFLGQRAELKDDLVIGNPHRAAGGDRWQLSFSRRLRDAEGRFDGVVVATVDASYFVSSYDPASFGSQGLLGIVRSHGTFLIRRSGNTLSAGGKSGYAAMLASAGAEDGGSALLVDSSDRIERYVSVRPLLYELGVVTGLSAAEQLAPARQQARKDLWRAAAGSVVLLLVVSVMGRFSRELAESRAKVAEERLAHAARVEYLAFHDGLTGLPNRNLFSRQLEQHIVESRDIGRQLAVLFLDLDGFKYINDTLGHTAGDQLLQDVAERLRASVRNADSVARLGGDEFVVLLTDIADDREAATMAQQLLDAISRPFMLLGQQFRITASLGIALYPRDGGDEHKLKKNADIAMYKAKQEGKNNFQFFTPQLNTSSLARLTLEAALRSALERGEFELYYHVRREISRSGITGVEALLRWHHPELGLVTPSQFIALAEETGLILPIGRWVLRTACAQTMAWQRQGLQKLTMAVNLTARQFFDERLPGDVGNILAETGLEPSLLELEINERLLLSEPAKTAQILTRLRRMGLRIALDDFGSGYASLATLQQFPLDTLKIGRGLLRDVGRVPGDQALAEAIIAMGKALSLTVVAHGVETGEQADFLRRNACDELQGFYLDRPVPAQKITEMLQARSVAGPLAL
jgi:diguanylate cyclase (GGDEF)-like protein